MRADTVGSDSADGSNFLFVADVLQLSLQHLQSGIAGSCVENFQEP